MRGNPSHIFLPNWDATFLFIYITISKKERTIIMSEAIYEIALDLHSTMSQASLAVKQGDTDRKIYISLREDGKPYRIERGAFAVFSTITPEGKVIEDNCIIEDNKIVYGFTEALTASVGIMDVEIRLYDVNSKHIISPVFTLIVDPRAAVGDKVKEATDSFTSLDGMYNKLNAVANEVQTKLDNGEFVGETGTPAGFGEVTADAVSLSPGTPPTVSIKTSGPDTAKNFKFSFGIPESGIKKSEAASAIRNFASGAGVALTDISPLGHTLGIKARSENILPYPFYETTKTAGGVTFTDNGDSSLTLNGDATSNITFWLASPLSERKIGVGAYTVSVFADKAISGNAVAVIQRYNESQTMEKAFGETANTLTFTNDKEGYLAIRFFVYSGASFDNVTFRFKLKEGTKATPFTPHIADITTAKVIDCGKNHFDKNNANIIHASFYGGGNKIYAQGNCAIYIPCMPKQAYTVSKKSGAFTFLRMGSTAEIPAVGVTLVDFKIGGTDLSSLFMETSAEARYLVVNITNYDETLSNEELSALLGDIQIELGKGATEYESFKRFIAHPINADGTVEGVTSLYPTTTLIPDTEGIVIDVDYNADTKKYIDDLYNKIQTLLMEV